MINSLRADRSSFFQGIHTRPTHITPSEHSEAYNKEYAYTLGRGVLEKGATYFSGPKHRKTYNKKVRFMFRGQKSQRVKNDEVSPLKIVYIFFKEYTRDQHIALRQSAARPTTKSLVQCRLLFSPYRTLVEITNNDARTCALS